MGVKIESTLYYADWCGHCVHFKPEWKRLEGIIKENNGKFGDVKISVNKYEQKEIKGSPKIAGKDIRGYPTVKISVSSNGKTKEYEYDGKRTAEDVLNHLKT